MTDAKLTDAELSDAEPSRTAQHVAAARLAFERLPAPYGDPEADAALARDVAGSGAGVESERMGRYLEGRTAFFDRVVVRALERDTLQVISVAAGYDGRALRYAKAGVRWFEVDLPATQRDKLARLERLGIDVAAITFVGFDLRSRGLSDALLAAGVEPDAPTLIISEGLLVYLEVAVVASLANDLRALATAGTRLVVSSSLAATWDEPERRARFERRLAELGEPTRNRLDRQGLTELLDDARWRVVELSDRAQRAGFIVAAPKWAPAPAGASPTLSRVGAYMERLYYRAGDDGLAGHLETTYGISVRRMYEIDVGVWRVGRDRRPRLGRAGVPRRAAGGGRGRRRRPAPCARAQRLSRRAVCARAAGLRALRSGRAGHRVRAPAKGAPLGCAVQAAR